MQITAIDPNTPLVVLSKSKDSKFLYVQSEYASGWIDINKIAFTSLSQITNILSNPNFLVVTNKNSTISFDNNDLLYQMGAKINFDKCNKSTCNVYLPFKEDKRLIYKKRSIDIKDDFSIGYLKYNYKNFYKQSFKFLNEEYGWGGQNNSVDCSSYVQDVFKTFGIKLPRSTYNMRYSLPNIYSLKKSNENDIEKVLDNIRPSSLLLKRGHVMMYLGKHNNTHYVIHAISSYYKGSKKIYIRKVLVSSLYFKTQNQKNMIQNLTAISSFIK